MLRYQFLQSVLLGGTDDRLVLADLLEEQGDAELASWCREQKEGIDERVEFVLALLPYQITLRLGCEFVAAVGFEYVVGEKINRNLKEIYDWLGYAETDPSKAMQRISFGAEKQVHRIPNAQHEIFEPYPLALHCLSNLAEAVMWGERAFTAQMHGRAAEQASAAQATGERVRSSVRLISHYASVVARPADLIRKRSYEKKWWLSQVSLQGESESDFNSRRLDQFSNWKIQHVQRELVKLIESGNNKP